MRTLRQLAGKEPRARIARALRRSPAAVTFKAFKLRLSLRVREKSRGKAVATQGGAKGKSRVGSGARTKAGRKATPAGRSTR